MMEIIIHIEWEGPYSLDQLDTLKHLGKDRGLYQIYGHHPVYGPNVLLYIGQTYGRTFGERIEEHNFSGGSQEDRAHIEVYVGRLKGVTTTPSSDDWRNEINWAEKLLLYVHAPAYNPQHMMELNEDDPRVRSVRVFNWGASERYVRRSRVAGGQKLRRMKPTLTRFMRSLDCADGAI